MARNIDHTRAGGHCPCPGGIIRVACPFFLPEEKGGTLAPLRSNEILVHGVACLLELETRPEPVRQSHTPCVRDPRGGHRLPNIELPMFHVDIVTCTVTRAREKVRTGPNQCSCRALFRNIACSDSDITKLLVC